MKARSRREIIDENRALRKQIREERLETSLRIKNAMCEVERATERLRRAGLSGRYQYTAQIPRGTVETCDKIDPVNLCGGVNVPANLEAMRDIVAGQLAKALVENGLVMIENAGIDEITGTQKVYARVSVVPWESMARKCTFERPGAWRYYEE